LVALLVAFHVGYQYRTEIAALVISDSSLSATPVPAGDSKASPVSSEPSPSMAVVSASAPVQPPVQDVPVPPASVEAWAARVSALIHGKQDDEAKTALRQWQEDFCSQKEFRTQAPYMAWKDISQPCQETIKYLIVPWLRLGNSALARKIASMPFNGKSGGESFQRYADDPELSLVRFQWWLSGSKGLEDTLRLVRELRDSRVSTSPGPGFDCDHALIATEKKICASPTLARLDEVLKVYADASGQIQSPVQKEWLGRRNKCGSDESCLKRAYENRIAELWQNHKGQNTAMPADNPYRRWVIDMLVPLLKEQAEKQAEFSRREVEACFVNFFAGNHNSTKMTECIVSVVNEEASAAWKKAEEGDKESEKKAFDSFMLAAGLGHEDARFNMGRFYDTGRGTGRDDAKARHWYSLAAIQGHATAQNSLGTMYELGQGGEEDFCEAMRLYRLAAEQGDAGAQYNLARMYWHGLCDKKDLKTACELYAKSAAQGYEKAERASQKSCRKPNTIKG
jgi:uncharacterized protein